MFPLDGGRLVRIKKDGSYGETICTQHKKFVFGSAVLCDHHIKDLSPVSNICCEIATDDFGRVSDFSFFVFASKQSDSIWDKEHAHLDSNSLHCVVIIVIFG